MITALLVWLVFFSWLHWEITETEPQKRNWREWLKTVTGRALMLVIICFAVLIHFLLSCWDWYKEGKRW